MGKAENDQTNKITDLKQEHKKSLTRYMEYGSTQYTSVMTVVKFHSEADEN